MRIEFILNPYYFEQKSIELRKEGVAPDART